jgi:hypothetical protein
MVLLGSLSGACSTGFGSYCEKARLCEGGNDTDQHACELDWGEKEQYADLHNCDTEYDDYADCYFANARCNNGVYAPDQKLCASLAGRYQRCIAPQFP